MKKKTVFFFMKKTFFFNEKKNVFYLFFSFFIFFIFFNQYLAFYYGPHLMMALMKDMMAIRRFRSSSLSRSTTRVWWKKG